MSISFHQLRRLGLFAALVVSVVVISSEDAIAQDIPAGGDNYIIQSSSTLTLPPGLIPADFFGPGSDPFEGTVYIDGDTTVDRINDVTFPGGPSPVETTVPIELVALHLVSIEPITVTHNGGQDPELWDLSIELPGPGPTPAPAVGTLTPTKTHANGGTFDSTLNVEPVYIFTRVSGPLAISMLSYYWENIPPFDLNSMGDDWSNQNPDGIPPNASNFYPGGTPGNQAIPAQTITLNGGPLQLDLVLAPEPATLSLLAVGGLLVLRRKARRI